MSNLKDLYHGDFGPALILDFLVNKGQTKQACFVGGQVLMDKLE